MVSDIIEKLLLGASLSCVMQPDDEIPTNRPLHDECFQLPHIIIDGDNFTAITARDLVTRPEAEWPIVFYYANYMDMFGTLNPVSVEPGYNTDNHLRMSFSPRKRYRKFRWLLSERYSKIWDSQGEMNMEAVRAAVLRAARVKVAFLDQEDVWNIHPTLLPQVACHEDSFLLQAGYAVYPYLFRKTQKIHEMIDSNLEYQRYFDEEKRCFTEAQVVFTQPFHAFYHLHHDGSYKNYYDLARGDTMSAYQRLMVFAEE